MDRKSFTEELIKRGITIASAESLTAGMFSSMIADVPGASEVLRCSITVYTNEMKVALLGVDRETVDELGAVSAETSKQMALGLKKLCNADICVSATGNAGPGTSEGKPVGLVYISCLYDNNLEVRELRLSGNRNEIRSMTCDRMITLIKEMIG